MCRDIERSHCFDSPGGTALNALRMVGKLSVKKLGEAVALIRCGEEGELVAENLNAIVELLMNEAALARRRSDEAINRRSVTCCSSGDGKGGSIAEQDCGEADDGDVEGREVSAEARGDTVGVVRTQGRDRAFENGLFGEDELIVGVDGIDQLSADGLTDAHGEMIVGLNGKWSSDGEGDGRRLAQGCAGCQQEWQEQGVSERHLD